MKYKTQLSCESRDWSAHGELCNPSNACLLFILKNQVWFDDLNLLTKCNLLQSSYIYDWGYRVVVVWCLSVWYIWGENNNGGNEDKEDNNNGLGNGREELRDVY